MILLVYIEEWFKIVSYHYDYLYSNDQREVLHCFRDRYAIPLYNQKYFQKGIHE